MNQHITPDPELAALCTKRLRRGPCRSRGVTRVPSYFDLSPLAAENLAAEAKRLGVTKATIVENLLEGLRPRE